MVNPQLMAFSKVLRDREDLRLAVSGATAPEQIVTLAEDLGYRFTVANLREALPLLGGPHWAWAGRDPLWVLAYFAGAFAAAEPGPTPAPAGPDDGGVQVEWLHERAEDWRRRKTG